VELHALTQFDRVFRWAICLCRLGKAVSSHWLKFLVKCFFEVFVRGFAECFNILY
jgi:hypothetical protein